jgi:hypothetical protein
MPVIEHFNKEGKVIEARMMLLYFRLFTNIPYNI